MNPANQPAPRRLSHENNIVGTGEQPLQAYPHCVT
jgi:hypothetical protein